MWIHSTIIPKRKDDILHFDKCLTKDEVSNLYEKGLTYHKQQLAKQNKQ